MLSNWQRSVVIQFSILSYFIMAVNHSGCSCHTWYNSIKNLCTCVIFWTGELFHKFLGLTGIKWMIIYLQKFKKLIIIYCFHLSISAKITPLLLLAEHHLITYLYLSLPPNCRLWVKKGIQSRIVSKTMQSGRGQSVMWVTLSYLSDSIPGMPASVCWTLFSCISPTPLLISLAIFYSRVCVFFPSI